MQRTRFIGGAGLRVTADMLEKVLTMFDLRDSFDALARLKNCLTASRIRKYISTAQQTGG